MSREECRTCSGTGKVYDSLAKRYIICERCCGAGWLRGKDDEPCIEDGDEPDELLWPESIRWIHHD